MTGAFFKALSDCLAEYKITGPRIFTDWLFKQANIEKMSKNDRFRDHHPFSGTGGLFFYYNGLEEHLPKLYELLHCDDSNRSSWSYLRLDYETNTRHLLDKFKEDIKEMTEKQLRSYQTLSQVEFARRNLEQIRSLSDDLIAYLNANMPCEFDHEYQQLTLLMLGLQGMWLQMDDTYYSTRHTHVSGGTARWPVLDCASYLNLLKLQLQDFTSVHPLLLQNAKIAESLGSINKVILDYEKGQGVIKKVNAFQDVLETFFSQYQINAAQCNVFVDTICRMVNMPHMPAITSYNIRKTDIHVQIADMDKENVLLLLKFFKSFGEEDVELQVLNEPCRVEKVDILNSSIRIDGELLINTIFPEVKNFFTSFAESQADVIRQYQEKSNQPVAELPAISGSRPYASGIQHTLHPPRNERQTPYVSVISNTPNIPMGCCRKCWAKRLQPVIIEPYDQRVIQ